MSKIKIFFILILGTGAIGSGAYYYELLPLPSYFNKKTISTVSVDSTLAAKPNFIFSAAGVIEPFNEVHQISSELVGIIKEVNISQNSQVKTGDIIVTIENSLQTANLDNNKALLALRIAELSWAKKEYTRQSKLGISGDLSQSASDMAKKNYEVALAQKAVAEANLKQAEVLFNKTIIRSPIDGAILKRYVLPGEAVSNVPPTLITSIANTEHLRVRAEVDENDLSKVFLNQPVNIKTDSYRDKTFHGFVSEIAPQVGNKKVQTGRSQENADTKVMEVIVALDKGTVLPIGLRVDVFFKPDMIAQKTEDNLIVTDIVIPSTLSSTNSKNIKPDINKISSAPEIKLNQPTHDTPLIDAVRHGQTSKVISLIEAGMEKINAKNSDGLTALSLAVQNGHIGIVEALIAAGADVNARTATGTTALLLATQHGYVDIITMLIKAGATVPSPSPVSQTTASEKAGS